MGYFKPNTKKAIKLAIAIKGLTASLAIPTLPFGITVRAFARFDASAQAKLVRPHVLSALSPQALKGVRSGFFSGPHESTNEF